MKNNYLFIPADPALPCKFISIPDSTDYDCNEFNDRVDELLSCDLYESVWLYSDLVMLVDESGKLKAKPVNPRASFFYRGTAYGDPIVGDAIICGTRYVNTDLGDGELIQELSFGPLNDVYKGILTKLLNIAS